MIFREINVEVSVKLHISDDINRIFKITFYWFILSRDLKTTFKKATISIEFKPRLKLFSDIELKELVSDVKEHKNKLFGTSSHASANI